MARVSAIAAFPTAVEVSSAMGANVPGFPALLASLMLLASVMLLASQLFVYFPAWGSTVAGDPAVHVALLFLL